MKIKTIKINEGTWKKLSKWKIDLDCQTLAEVIDRIVSIVPASEIKSRGQEVQSSPLNNQELPENEECFL